MEDTQMSSADVPQAPQPDANPAPAPQAEAPQTPAPKKGGVIMKALIGVFAVAIVGFGGWYAYNSGISGAAEDTPPSLSLGAAGFQGKSVETTFGFLQLDHADVSAHVDRPGSVYMTSETGVRWFYPKANTTFGEIESAFKPIAGMKILMAFYDAEEPWPGDSDGIKKGCFVTYPIGPYQHTCLGDLETPIDKNRGLAVITNIPSVDNVTPVFEYDSTLLGDAKTLSDGLILPDLKGWTLHPFAAGMDLTDSKIRSVWIQTNAAEIKTQVTDVSSVDTSSEYKMMWLRLGDPVDAGTTTDGGGTPPGICGDGTVDAGETCDDGNTIDGDGCSATCTTEAVCGDGTVDAGETCDDGNTTDGDGCSATCTTEAVCGDGTVDAGETCDDGNTTDGDGCSATCTIEAACGNDTIDGTDVCDGTDLGGKDCTDYTNTNGSAFTGGTLECAADCSAYDTSACTLCGDGIKAGTEECDDGNNNSDTAADACRTTCVAASCGDGVVDAGEACDDGNTVDGDGCESDCSFIFSYDLALGTLDHLLSTSVSYIDNLAAATINGKPLTFNYSRYGNLYTTREQDYFTAQAVAAIKVTPQGDENYYIFGDININTEGFLQPANGTSITFIEDLNFCAGTDIWRAVVLYEDSDGSGSIKEAYISEDVDKDGTFTYSGLVENKESVLMYPGEEYVLVIVMDEIDCPFTTNITPFSHTMITSFDLHNPANDKVTYSEDSYTNSLETKFIEWTE